MSTQEDLTIRRMTEADVFQVAHIEQVSFTTAWSARAYYEEIALPFDYSLVGELAENTGSLVCGYITSWLVSGEANLLKVAVHPRYRRRGIGSALLRRSLDFFNDRGIEKVWLEVRATNTAAREFYKAHGFAYHYTRNRYYSDTGEDALVMARQLS